MSRKRGARTSRSGVGGSSCVRVHRALLAFSRQLPCGGPAAQRAVKKRYETMPPPTRNVMAAVRASQARQASRRDDAGRRASHAPSPGRLCRPGTVSCSVSRFTKVLPFVSVPESQSGRTPPTLSGEGGYRRITRRKRSRLPRDEGTCAACGSESREEPGTHTLFPHASATRRRPTRVRHHGVRCPRPQMQRDGPGAPAQGIGCGPPGSPVVAAAVVAACRLGGDGA